MAIPITEGSTSSFNSGYQQGPIIKALMPSTTAQCKPAGSTLAHNG